MSENPWTDDPTMRPAKAADVQAGLATHPGVLEPHRETLTSRSGPQNEAFKVATATLERVHTSIGDMVRAAEALRIPRPENRVLRPDGKGTMYVVPEAEKEQTRVAMAQSFENGSRRLNDAHKVIDKAESQIQSAIDNRLRNARANETAVAGTAAQIRDLVRGLPLAERMPFVRQAILDGDLEITSAVLGHSPFVSGLTRQQSADLRADAERKFAPSEHGEREALRGVRERLAGAGRHYLDRLQNLLPPKNLRAAESARALKQLQAGARS